MPGFEIFSIADDPSSGSRAPLSGAADPEFADKGRRTVLVVDDEPLIVDTTAAALERLGFRVFRAYSGRRALDLAMSILPDLLLTDVLMPGMNGVELAIEIRRLLPSTGIVLFSGQAGISGLLHEAHLKGLPFKLAAKPMHPEKLAEFLRKI